MPVERTPQEIIEAVVEEVLPHIESASTRVRKKKQVRIQTRVGTKGKDQLLSAMICPENKTGIRVDVDAIRRVFTDVESSVHPFLKGKKRNINVPCVRFMAVDIDIGVIMVDIFLFPVDFAEC